MQCQKDELDDQIAKHQEESIVLSHATTLVDGASKSTTVAMDLNVDSIGDRQEGSTTFSVLISENENYNGEVMLHHEFRWTSRHKKDHPSHLPPSEAIKYLAELVDQAITDPLKVLAYLELPFIVSWSTSARDLYSVCIQITGKRVPGMTGYTTSTGRWVFEGQWRFQCRSGVLWT